MANKTILATKIKWSASVNKHFFQKQSAQAVHKSKMKKLLPQSTNNVMRVDTLPQMMLAGILVGGHSVASSLRSSALLEIKKDTIVFNRKVRTNIISSAKGQMIEDRKKLSEAFQDSIRRRKKIAEFNRSIKVTGNILSWVEPKTSFAVFGMALSDAFAVGYLHPHATLASQKTYNLRGKEYHVISQTTHFKFGIVTKTMLAAAHGGDPKAGSFVNGVALSITEKEARLFVVNKHKKGVPPSTPSTLPSSGKSGVPSKDGTTKPSTRPLPSRLAVPPASVSVLWKGKRTNGITSFTGFRAALAAYWSKTSSKKRDIRFVLSPSVTFASLVTAMAESIQKEGKRPTWWLQVPSSKRK